MRRKWTFKIEIANYYLFGAAEVHGSEHAAIWRTINIELAADGANSIFDGFNRNGLG
jgi:hypothetical protein